MSNLSRLFLMTLLAGIFAWGTLVASVDQQEALGRFVQSAVRDGPHIAASSVQRAGNLLMRLVE